MTLIIEPKTKDIGFPVRRLLPARQCQRVGPFIFVDHMGPAKFEKGTTAGDVRQHPHIGLATVTYLFSGAMMHRDSLGVEQRIEPGAINLMTAGRGIVHSERMPSDVREGALAVQGIQTWLALPIEQEEVAPSFDHYPREQIPTSAIAGGSVRVLIGELEGVKSPVVTHSETSYFELKLAANSQYQINIPGHELAVYLASGELVINGEQLKENQLFVGEGKISLRTASIPCHAMILGGVALEGKRYLHWNFVSSRIERIKQASEDWEQKRFDLVPGETEFIPLPK